MKKTLPLACLAILNLALLTTGHAQLFKVALDEKVSSSSLIAEGRVISQKSFWDDAHTMIYTSNTIKVYKTFKGRTTASTIEVVTQGGFVGMQGVEVSDLLGLQKNQVGVFFCNENAIALKSPDTKKVLYDVYSSDQGFLRYDFVENKAYAPYASYDNIEGGLYTELEKQTGETRRIIDEGFSVSQQLALSAGSSNSIVANTQTSIASFSPATVHSGAINDPTNNVLTITGAGFGNTPTGTAAVNFKDGNSNNTTPDYPVAYNSPYMVSWTDTKIVVRVPGRAATGKISVTVAGGATTQSPNQLKVYFAVMSFAFDSASFGFKASAAVEPRLMNTNGKGGYSYLFSTSTAGKGINLFKDDSARAAFTRAVATWQELVGANFIAGGNTTTQAVANDGLNIVEYDNLKTGTLPMAAGVLEVTYSYPSFCYVKSPFKVYAAQKMGFDILLRNPNVSKPPAISFSKGPCFPVGGSYDLENVILHELGHALDLGHVNDPYEASPAAYIHVNPGAIMHFGILDYVDRRSPDNSAYTGALYTITAQNNEYGTCGLNTTEMIPLDYTPITNDECPAKFPAKATKAGVVVRFDLVHATANKLKDPAFTQINKQNTGVPVTNNAWYALKTSTNASGTLTLNITGYLTTPSTLASCTGQGVQMAVYKVTACPVGQAFPQPIAAATFSGNGALTAITGLTANSTYLLYFDGLRNTKAKFNVTLNGTAVTGLLANIDGEYKNGVNNLNINIDEAANISNVVIEKSADGNNFTALGELQAAPSELEGKHNYVDAQPYAGTNFYRLKFVDYDGNAQYSTVSILKNAAARAVYVYPNPAKNNASVSFSGIQAGRYNITVYNIAGKAVYKSTHTINAGNQMVNLPLTGIASGVYMVKITSSTGEAISQQKLVKE